MSIFSQPSHNDIVNFLNFLIDQFCISTTYQNQYINAIKFYYEKVLRQKKTTYNLQRPKKENKLPLVLSVSEVERLLSAIDNLKHRCILALIYASGLRVSELINLKITDIHSERGLIHIRDGKGHKDRYSLLPKSLIPQLRQYYKEWKPGQFLFEGPTLHSKYSSSSIRKIMQRALKKAKVNSNATPHTLRHSFATHLLESGTNLRYIQELLGHQSSKTTEIYTHISQKNIENICSSLDKLYI